MVMVQKSESNGGFGEGRSECHDSPLFQLSQGQAQGVFSEMKPLPRESQ